MKTVVITGGTDGMGKALALTYLRRGDRVIILGTNEPKGRAVLAAAAELGAADRAEFLRADLSLVSENRRVLTRIAADHPIIDILVFAARYYRATRFVTAEGFEATFALFYLSRYLFGHALAPNLDRATTPVILNLAGPGGELSEIHWDDLQFAHHYDPDAIMHQSGKLNDLLAVSFTHRHSTIGRRNARPRPTRRSRPHPHPPPPRQPTHAPADRLHAGHPDRHHRNPFLARSRRPTRKTHGKPSARLLGGQDGAMRLLVLGGTSFLSKQVAAEAVTRGHDVVCVARGVSGAVPEGARLVRIDRDEPGAITALAGERFDAAVDVATGALGWVRDALEVLADNTGHWTFVSSINAYADTATVGQTIDSALCEPVWDARHYSLSELTVERYGGTKVASEITVRERMGSDRSFVIRPGIISGPGDQMDRFGYWVARFARGGRTVVPDTPRQPLQHIDVRDLAAWIVSSAEQRLTGTYDAVGPVLELGSVLRRAAELVGAADLELVPIAPDTLTDAGVNPWGGPRSLPLWLPADKYGLLTHDPDPALAAGLAPRSLADTVHTALADEHARGLDRTRAAGLTSAEEQQILEYVA